MAQWNTSARPVPAAGAGISTAMRDAITRVYFWMSLGLAVTALVAMAVASSQSMQDAIFGNRAVFFLAIAAQFGIVIAFRPLAQRLPSTGVAALFLAYSALSGLTFSTVFLVYTKQSIATTFFITAGTFGAVALFGATTKRDLSKVGAFAFMALIGLILATVVNIFLQSTALMYLTSYIGVLIFVALTAYDMQKITQSAGAFGEASVERERWALQWALRLYLDFINLFLFFLRIFGGGSRR